MPKPQTPTLGFFSLALHAFFHYAVLHDPNDATAWLHLALVLDHIYDDLDRAETCYIQAQTLASKDPCIAEVLEYRNVLYLHGTRTTLRFAPHCRVVTGRRAGYSSAPSAFSS